MAKDATVRIDLASEFTGKKAFSQADKATQKLTKGVKSLASAFGVAFGARALGMYAKKAVNAFAADEKAARSLALQLKNTGNAFAAPQVEAFIANLQKTTGVLDDSLRPAFQSILTATGDVALSQKALSLALDISAGTGKDLGAVSIALAKGFGGQTTALSRLGAGLDKATLASGDMDKITTILTGKFKGQALEAVKGYAGQMALLQVASANSAEIIGEGLLDAVALLGKDNSVSDLASDMESIATQTANVIRGIGVLIAKIKSIPGLSTLSKLVGETSLAGQAVGALGKLGASTQPKGYGSSNTVENFLAMGGVIKKNTITFKANTTQIKANTELSKLAAKFDVERIGLYAALASATSEEEKARIKAKIAILEQNEAGAKALNTLSQAAFLAADAITKYAANQTVKIGSGPYAIEAPQGFLGNTTATNSAQMPATNIPVGPTGNAEVFNAISGTYMPQGMAQQFVANVTVSAGTITNEQGVVDVVQQALQEINARGWSQFKTGALAAS
tara:strand:- start:1405 stop:2931 length:1527 start_codon:yes stop_codon:yes gene_type:complete